MHHCICENQTAPRDSEPQNLIIVIIHNLTEELKALTFQSLAATAKIALQGGCNESDMEPGAGGRISHSVETEAFCDTKSDLLASRRAAAKIYCCA